MKSSEVKCVWNWFTIADIEREEKWLNEMAHRTECRAAPSAGACRRPHPETAQRTSRRWFLRHPDPFVP